MGINLNSPNKFDSAGFVMQAQNYMNLLIKRGIMVWFLLYNGQDKEVKKKQMFIEMGIYSKRLGQISLKISKEYGEKTALKDREQKFSKER